MTDSTNPKDKIGATKPPISLIPPVALIHISMAMKNGADKYGAYNWREKKVQMMIYLDALLRHTLALIDGEDLAQDSMLEHLAHIGANAAILLDAKESGNLIDNRPIKGKAADVIKKFTAYTNLEKMVKENQELGFYEDDVSSLLEIESIIKLSQKESEQFIKNLENRPKPHNNLKELVKEHTESLKKEQFYVDDEGIYHHADQYEQQKKAIGPKDSE